jgi:hypothetical protein
MQDLTWFSLQFSDDKSNWVIGHLMQNRVESTGSAFSRKAKNGAAEYCRDLLSGRMADSDIPQKAMLVSRANLQRSH